MTSTTSRREANEQINPWTWQEALGYSQAVLAPPGRRTLHLAGQCSIDAEGVPVHIGDVAGQAGQCMDNVEKVLAAAGMTLADVVRYDLYVTDLQRYFAAGHEQVVARFAGVGVLPAGGICAQVSALAVPGLEVEVVVTACA